MHENPPKFAEAARFTKKVQQNGRQKENSPALTGLPIFWSGRRESNPRLLLGRQGHYHYATPALDLLETTFPWFFAILSNGRAPIARRTSGLVGRVGFEPTYRVKRARFTAWCL